MKSIRISIVMKIYLYIYKYHLTAFLPDGTTMQLGNKTYWYCNLGGVSKPNQTKLNDDVSLLAMVVTSRGQKLKERSNLEIVFFFL